MSCESNERAGIMEQSNKCVIYESRFRPPVITRQSREPWGRPALRHRNPRTRAMHGCERAVSLSTKRLTGSIPSYDGYFFLTITWKQQQNLYPFSHLTNQNSSLSNISECYFFNYSNIYKTSRHASVSMMSVFVCAFLLCPVIEISPCYAVHACAPAQSYKLKS
jgi:hypothetical protein